MKYTYLAVGVIGICIAISCKNSGKNNQQEADQINTNNAVLHFETHKIDMGNITVNDTTRNAIFDFTNIGKEPLLILKVTTSCHCTVAESPQKPIKPGESGQIKIKFSADGKTGSFNKSIYVKSNAENKYEILYIKGNIH